MKIKIHLLIFLLFSLQIFAQINLKEIKLILPHSINPGLEEFKIRDRVSSVDTFYLLAVMVDFAVDQDAATYGNGKFGSHYSRDYGKSIIDPLPHDRNYFRAHLEFLRNYYLNVSNGRVVIEYEVLDKIVSLPNVMSYYSPPPKSNDLSKLGLLFEKVWTAVDSLYPNQDFTKYDVFTIFHAGVGRDIVIPETFGLEKDIPSVYLSPSLLKSFFGENYKGVKIGNPPKFVNNSMILPETESREIETLTGRTLLELSINGLLAASFGSFLGLPDLFDTKTGKTAIGRMGLMDGQAMFAYAGLFPPEPSAWEKYFLGWVDPIEISNNAINLEVFTRLGTANNQKQVYKILINPREYYLIENRQGDVNSDGIKIKSRIGSNLVEYNFLRDFRRFASYYVDTVDGVVISVDEFDWALPGKGILIWHIDEKVIAENFVTNTINANPKLKGIRLIEADGIQDIGNEFKTVFGDVILGEGDSLDFWFKGNPAKLYQNKFSDETIPRTLSNNGSPTLINIYDFSENSNLMTFSVSFGNQEVKTIFLERIVSSFKTEFIHRNRLDSSKIFIKSNDKFFYYDLNTRSSYVLVNYSPTNVVVLDFSDKTIYASSRHTITNNIKELSLIYVYRDSTVIRNFRLPSTSEIKNLLTYKKFNSFGDERDYVIHILSELGEQYEFYFTNNNFNYTGIELRETAITSAFDGNKLVVLTSGYVYFGNDRVAHTIENPSDLVLMWDNSLSNAPQNRLLAAVINKAGFVEIVNATGSVSKFKLPLNDTTFSIAAGNLHPNETNYLILNTAEQIIAVNKAGAIADNFPISPPSGTKFVGSVSLLKYNVDVVNDILIMTQDGRVLIYNGANPSSNIQNSLLNFSIGYSSSGNHFVFNNNEAYLLLGNDSGYVHLLQISDKEKQIKWTMNSNDLLGHKVAEIPFGSIYHEEFLPKNKVYNWPNPVYGDQTFFRVYVSEPAQIRVKIFDLSGHFVDEITGFALGGVENEFAWNVRNIQSGIYYAKVEANSNNKSDFKIIKVAVVK